MRHILPAALALLLAAGAARAQPAPPGPTIEQTVERIADLNAKAAEIAKLRATEAATLKKQLADLAAKIDRLNLDDAGPAPKPPEPKPNPPGDPLRAKLKAALDASAGTPAEKFEQARDLAALYRAAAKLCADPTLATAGQLRARLAEASAALIGPDALKEVRRAVAGELAAVLPTTDADLSGEQREAAAKLFRTLAAHLEEIAK